MDKELVDLTFDELVKRGIQFELDAIVSGKSLHQRVYSLMNLATQWRHEKTQEESKKNG